MNDDSQIKRLSIRMAEPRKDSHVAVTITPTEPRP